MVIFAVLSIVLSNKQRTYTNSAYNYKFSYSKSSNIIGSTPISKADAIGVMTSNNDTLRIQVIEKPNVTISNAPLVESIQIGKNKLDYVKVNGPCNYVLEDNKIYLCILTTLTPEELQNNKELFNLLKSITFF